jgi:hypothetical protein
MSFPSGSTSFPAGGVAEVCGVPGLPIIRSEAAVRRLETAAGTTIPASARGRMASADTAKSPKITMGASNRFLGFISFS